MSFKKDLAKYSPRKEQLEAIQFIQSEREKNPLTKFFLLNLPTGVGKSHLALMLVEWYRANVNKMARVDVITNSKILQDQYSNTYDSICNLKGKENYECESYSTSCGQGMEFSRLNKTKCESCPFISSREGFMSGGIGLTNFYLYILYAMYNQKMLREVRDARVLIVDEAHDFDDVMSDFISIKLTESMVKKYKFAREGEIIRDLKSVNSISSYIALLKGIEADIEATLESMSLSISDVKRSKVSDVRNNKVSKVTKEKNSDMKAMEIMSDLSQFKIKIDVFLKEYSDNPNNWILEQNYNEKLRQKELSLEPIWAYDYLEKYVFSQYDMVFLMSGTILDKNLFCQLNGLDVSKASYYSIPSPFKAENRPIIYMPLGKMSYKNKEETFQRYIPYIKKILEKYKDKKGIIHTNSFELSNWIKKSINDSRLIFHDSTNKEEMLKLHFNSDEPTVIVSPSVDTGVSFDDDLARFQIIAKIPYPSLASQKNKMRMSNNPDWYSWKTCTNLIQMCGRPIRSEEDYSDTIILDGSFGDILRYSSNFLPEWLQDAIRKVNVKVT